MESLWVHLLASIFLVDMETVKLLEKTIMIIRMKLRELRRRVQSLRIEVGHTERACITAQSAPGYKSQGPWKTY